MHDVLEGVAPYEMKMVLHQLTVDKLLTLRQVNIQIADFGYGWKDITTRPSEIKELKNVKDGAHSLGQKAFQFYTLLRLLPLMIGHLIPPSNQYWDFFLQLRHVVDLLFAQKWTHAIASQFRNLYQEHLLSFKILFPTFRLIPKHHHLIHYGTFALKTGPPYKVMVASEEMKHNFFKRTAGIMCNFRNVTLSLSNKHQWFAFCNRNSKKSSNSCVDVMKTEEMSVLQLSNGSALLSILGLDETGLCTIATKFSLFGQKYIAGDVLPLRIDDFIGLPVFGKLVGALVSDKCKDVQLIFEILHSVDFDYHYHSYLVEMLSSPNHCVCKLADLLDYHPLDWYPTTTVDVYRIILRYIVF